MQVDSRYFSSWCYRNYNCGAHSRNRGFPQKEIDYLNNVACESAHKRLQLPVAMPHTYNCVCRPMVVDLLRVIPVLLTRIVLSYVNCPRKRPMNRCKVLTVLNSTSTAPSGPRPKLIYLPLLRDVVVIWADKKLNTPRNYSEENIHPAPPNLG